MNYGTMPRIAGQFNRSRTNPQTSKLAVGTSYPPAKNYANLAHELAMPTRCRCDTRSCVTACPFDALGLCRTRGYTPRESRNEPRHAPLIIPVQLTEMRHQIALFENGGQH